MTFNDQQSNSMTFKVFSNLYEPCFTTSSTSFSTHYYFRTVHSGLVISLNSYLGEWSGRKDLIKLINPGRILNNIFLKLKETFNSGSTWYSNSTPFAKWHNNILSREQELLKSFTGFEIVKCVSEKQFFKVHTEISTLSAPREISGQIGSWQQKRNRLTQKQKLYNYKCLGAKKALMTWSNHTLLSTHILHTNEKMRSESESKPVSLNTRWVCKPPQDQARHNGDKPTLIVVDDSFTNKLFHGMFKVYRVFLKESTVYANIY